MHCPRGRKDLFGHICAVSPGAVLFSDGHLFWWMSDNQLARIPRLVLWAQVPQLQEGDPSQSWWHTALLRAVSAHYLVPSDAALILPVRRGRNSELPRHPWLLPTQHPRGTARDLPWPARTLCMPLLASWKWDCESDGHSGSQSVI